MVKYFDELKRAMEYLGEQEDTVFLGQAVAYKGTAMSNTLKDIDPEKLIEMPVCEEMQMGITNGLAVTGKVIIRTGIGSERPLNPQAQHVGDFTEGFRLMLKNTEIIRLKEPEDIFPAYQKAYNRTDGKNTILVEYGDFYNEK